MGNSLPSPDPRRYLPWAQRQAAVASRERAKDNRRSEMAQHGDSPSAASERGGCPAAVARKIADCRTCQPCCGLREHIRQHAWACDAPSPGRERKARRCRACRRPWPRRSAAGNRRFAGPRGVRTCTCAASWPVSKTSGSPAGNSFHRSAAVASRIFSRTRVNFRSTTTWSLRRQRRRRPCPVRAILRLRPAPLRSVNRGCGKTRVK